MRTEPVDVRAAAQLLDFGTRMGAGQRAVEQLEGAVAIHNTLVKRGLAYLADEVGMGKTYVALGAVALFRHFNPDFRVLLIAPRRNIQQKWMKEFSNFVAHNVRFPDLRVKAADGDPARQLVACDSLMDLVHETAQNPNRDFFVRMTSFSLAVSGKDAVDTAAADKLRREVRKALPWMRDEVFALRSKQQFKDNIARALCCALPAFDLVIVDEGHNLKHGFHEGVSARNRVLALAMGHSASEPDVRLFPGLAPRARRVLFLSATPVEESYQQLWNQLHVLGVDKGLEKLRETAVPEEEKKRLLGEFLIRRVTAIRVGDTEHTKNLYRREWRRGGVRTHDEPIATADTRQRLVVALVQKKVSELLGHERFGSAFQIGMLASFESFLETTRLKRDAEGDANFDQSDQTEDALQREGIDVESVNRIAASYRRTFGQEMPHPKMDALVEALSTSWATGAKALVFVRRVASVKELKRKLDERYDTWLMERLRSELPEAVLPRLDRTFRQYEEVRRAAREARTGDQETVLKDGAADAGGTDTFFAWFFRGTGPTGMISGATVQERYTSRSSANATFFSRNYIAELLGVRPGSVEAALTASLEVSQDRLQVQLGEGAKRFLSRAKRHPRADRFDAAQAAAIELLTKRKGDHQAGARAIWHQRFESSAKIPHATEAEDLRGVLEAPTFFTEILQRPSLKDALWPEPASVDLEAAFRERELRAQMLASAARLGHALIDLYVMTVRRLGSLERRAQDQSDEDRLDAELSRIEEYLELLETQRGRAHEARGWGAYDELSEIAANYELIVDANLPEARSMKMGESPRLLGQLLRGQQPIGGMSGQINQTLVRQFRMPGYPLVLVTTDLLQEGEDLHTFCSAVHHYGIAWTPSSMEQRIGRVDRVRSHTERRLGRLKTPLLEGEEMLQVYFPHLEDTVEVLQVQRVLERMNVFLRLMHEGFATEDRDERTINTSREFARGRRLVPQIRTKLETAFPVRRERLKGNRELMATERDAKKLVDRFQSLNKAALTGCDIDWEPVRKPSVLLGTARLGHRVQPFSLVLSSISERLLVRCISPIGEVGPEVLREQIVASAEENPVRVGAIVTEVDRSYDLTVEGDVLLSQDASCDAARVGQLIARVVRQADYMERMHLPGEDAVIESFRSDLEKEDDGGE